MSTIEIQIPVEIDKQLEVVSRNKHQFILDAIKEKITNSKISTEGSLDQNLIEGYKSTYNEELSITNDFEPLDLEGWK